MNVSGEPSIIASTTTSIPCTDCGITSRSPAVSLVLPGWLTQLSVDVRIGFATSPLPGVSTMLVSVFGAVQYVLLEPKMVMSAAFDFTFLTVIEVICTGTV